MGAVSDFPEPYSLSGTTTLKKRDSSASNLGSGVLESQHRIEEREFENGTWTM